MCEFFYISMIYSKIDLSDSDENNKFRVNREMLILYFHQLHIQIDYLCNMK
jgi:hypothetical protein